MKKPYILLIALCLAASVRGQGLNKEITIEKEIVPEQRAATRLPVTHSVLTPEVKQTVPAFSSRGMSTEIAPEMLTLDPAASGDTLVPSPYRGYAAVGYFPSYNLGASAGYRFIDNDVTTLGAWGQFNGCSFSRVPVTVDEDAKMDVSDNSLKIGADFRRRITSSGKLLLNLDFGYGKSKAGDIDLNNRTATQFHFGAGWRHAAGKLRYDIDAFAGVFSNSVADERFSKLPRQLSYGASALVDYNGLSLGVSALVLNFNATPINSSESLGAVTVNPAYTYRSATTCLRIGLHADFSIHSGKSVTVAPDVRADYRHSPLFAVYAAADGGVKVNTMESIYDYSHFLTPTVIYGNSRVPLELRGGVVIGPFRGASLELFGGYAMADNWDMVSAGNYLVVMDVKAWHAGAQLSYNFRGLVSAKARVEAAPSSGNKVYYLWRDRAKTVVNIAVEAHPISALTLEAGWELRSGRKVELESPADLATLDLGNVNNLRFGASYRVTQPLTVFARGENLLGKKWDTVGNIPANGLCGLIGVGYKF